MPVELREGRGSDSKGGNARRAPLSLKGAGNFLGNFEFRASGRSFLILCRRNALMDPRLRLGVVVPKKVCPRAVDRNRVKRLVRETVRQSVCSSAELDIIVRTKVAVPKTFHFDAVAELKRLLEGITL